jgi:hypothetical protein
MVAGIAVGVELHGELSERDLELLFVGALLHAQCLVEISLHRLPQLLPSSLSPSASFAMPGAR